MPRPEKGRTNALRRRWDIALAHAGRRTHELAAAWGVHRSAVNGVLSGRITSARLHAKIEAFITKHAPRQGAA